MQKAPRIPLWVIAEKYGYRATMASIKALVDVSKADSFFQKAIRDERLRLDDKFSTPGPALET